jgi:hypothetical protein
MWPLPLITPRVTDVGFDAWVDLAAKPGDDLVRSFRTTPGVGSSASRKSSMWRPSGPARRLREAAVALAAYLVLFVVITFPLIRSFSTHFFADGGDGAQNVWNIWWVNEAVTTLHELPWYTRYLHFPHGTTLVGHTLNAFNGFLCCRSSASSGPTT